MPIDTAAILREIDDVLARFQEVEKQYTVHSSSYAGNRDYYISAPHEVNAEIITLLHSTIERLAPHPSYSAKALEGMSANNPDGLMRKLAGALVALRSDFVAGRVQKVQERIRSDVFSDFLQMAEYLIQDEGLKDPAAVLTGGVLEQHIRKLCDKHNIPTTFTNGKGHQEPKKLNTMNAELTKAGVYYLNEQQQVTAWAAIRNDAAHAHYEKYTAEKVELMIQGIRLFLSTYPA